MATDSSSPDKLTRILGDLGKPTLRGVRKCPKCGIYNGTRGISCKNKLCDAVFREKGEPRKLAPVDAVKIITGSTVQVFSVRLRDRGPDFRGFVQLPLVQDMDGNPATTVDVSLLEHNSNCYVESCLRALAGEVWGGDRVCSHVRAAIQCSKCPEYAVPLTLKNSVLNALNVSNEIKQAIWLLATETTGPLVQRVTKNMMVVKCKASTKHPLGFIHFAFFESKKRGKMDYRFSCNCRAFRGGKHGSEEKRRCVHFYACICAFASDEALAQEFAYFIDLDKKTVVSESENASQYICAYIPPVGATDAPDDAPEDTELLRDDSEAVEIVFSEGEPILLFPDKSQPAILPRGAFSGSGKRKKEAAILSIEDGSGDVSLLKKILKPSKPPAPASAGRKYPSNVTLDEHSTGITFQQWLSSVTERINQTMHYQFDGHPDPLVFHVPEPFFACLQQRICAGGGKKKRLPNATTGFVRREALPLGVFTKYTWHITNVIQVKQIFDTPEMLLEVTRSFVENRDHTYDLYDPPSDGDDPVSRNKPIKPCDLRTYLKVGLMLPNQKEPTPFTIEWIPDILPQSHIGELRIKFEYGHQRNGQIDREKSDRNVTRFPNIIASEPFNPQVLNSNEDTITLVQGDIDQTHEQLVQLENIDQLQNIEYC